MGKETILAVSTLCWKDDQNTTPVEDGEGSAQSDPAGPWEWHHGEPMVGFGKDESSLLFISIPAKLCPGYPLPGRSRGSTMPLGIQLWFLGTGAVAGRV